MTSTNKGNQMENTEFYSFIIYCENAKEINITTEKVDNITYNFSGNHHPAYSIVNGVAMLFINDGDSIVNIIVPSNISSVEIMHKGSKTKVKCSKINRLEFESIWGSIVVNDCEYVTVKTVHGDINLSKIDRVDASNVHGTITASNVKGGWLKLSHGKPILHNCDDLIIH